MNTVTSKDGTTIAYDKSGNGPAVILIDGAFCSRTFGPMPKLASHLEEQFTVFTYDRRGRGNSTNSKPYAVEREVEDIEALINAAGGSAFLYGISSGAALAIHAVREGLKVKKLALYEPPYVDGTSGRTMPANYQAKVREFIANDRRGDAVKYFMTKMIGAPSIVAFIMQFMPAWGKLKAVAHTLPYDIEIMGDYTVPTAIVGSVKVPTLIAGGTKSQAPLRNAVKLVAESLPHPTLRSLEGQTHNVKAEILAPVLVEFFNS